MTSRKTEIEQIEASSSSAILISDEDDLGSEDVEIPGNSHPERPRSPGVTECSICLQEITNRCHSNSCTHEFCFDCLKQWSTISAVCPLCKTHFRRIHYTSSTTGVAETYEVPVLPVNQLSIEWLFDDLTYRDYSVDEIATRRRVYNTNLRVLPLPDSRGHFRYISSHIFRSDVVQFNRLFEFVHRDLTAILPLVNVGSTDVDVPVNGITNCVMRTFMFYEIRRPEARRIVTIHLRDYTQRFINEVYNFASSLYNIDFYDQNVQYISHDGSSLFFYHRPNRNFNMINAIIISDSDDDDFIANVTTRNAGINTVTNPNEDSDETTEEDVVLISSSDDDNVRVNNPTSVSNELFGSLARDQPSTSTGIGIQSNNIAGIESYLGSTCLFHEEKRTCNRSTQTIIKREQKNQNKRMKNSDDSQSEGSRNRSYSDSSSDTDTD